MDSKKCYKHRPETVLDNIHVKLVWNFTIHLHVFTEHTKPNITLVIKSSLECLLVYVTCLWDHNIATQEIINIVNYSERWVDAARMCNVSDKVVPVVIGALWSIPKNLQKHNDSVRITLGMKTLHTK